MKIHTVLSTANTFNVAPMFFVDKRLINKPKNNRHCQLVKKGKLEKAKLEIVWPSKQLNLSLYTVSGFFMHYIAMPKWR